MRKTINFSGLSFEFGQMHAGLKNSAQVARNYFSILKNAEINLIDCGDIVSEDECSSVKVFSSEEISLVKWTKYQEVFLKSIDLLQEKIPLVSWGGDHSVAIPTIAAFTHCYNEGFVLWVDAHADLNLPNKSLTGNLHGMPLSILLNLENIADHHFRWILQTLDPKKLIYLGLRDLDAFESEMISKLGITTFSSDQIKQKGIESVCAEIKNIVKDFPLHLSFDIDSVDPLHAASTGVPVDRGLTPHDLSFLGTMIFNHLNVRSVDIVEINPLIGNQLEVDQTYITAFNFLKLIFSSTNQGEQYERMGKGYQTECFDEMEWSF